MTHDRAQITIQGNLGKFFSIRLPVVNPSLKKKLFNGIRSQANNLLTK